ncbi:zinc ribbon domain-containing protein [bacterium]|nr:zinc ribbon domain-containing protein [bacterium]
MLLPLLWAGGAIAAAQTKQTPVDDRQKLDCPHCHQPVEGDFTWCPNCAVRIKPLTCAYCRSSVPTEASACPHCGAPVS